MSTDRDVTRIVRSWLEDGATALPDRVLDAVLDQVPATRQRRSWGPARRFRDMNVYLKLAMAAAAAVVIAIVSINFLPNNPIVGGPGPTSTPTPTPTPAAFHEGPLTAGAYVMTPFAGADASGLCEGNDPGCSEVPEDDSIRLTLTIPDGYEGRPRPLIWGADGDTGLIILRGANLYSDPCHSTPPPDITVGPTVDDFANAIASHPILEATTPIDVTLAGYSGKYMDLQLPTDVSACTQAEFWPWEPGIYAQGSAHRWHLWILDVDGVRVVVQSMDYARTSAERRAELQAIVDSIEIEVVPAP
jgi:hypothetical protein